MIDCTAKVYMGKGILRDVDAPVHQSLFIVGCNVGPARPWIFIGVFDSRERALEACKDSRYFIGPVVLNVAYGSPAKPWPGAEVPKPEKNERIIPLKGFRQPVV